MTDEKKKRITELETELAVLLEGTNGFDEQYRRIKETNSGFFTGKFFREMDSADYKALCTYREKISELAGLYDELAYTPAEDEKALGFMLRDGMTTEEKLKALADAWWYATNSGYCDAMANRLMAGQEDAETKRWERFFKNKYAIDRYYNWLKEQSEG